MYQYIYICLQKILQYCNHGMISTSSPRSPALEDAPAQLLQRPLSVGKPTGDFRSIQYEELKWPENHKR